MIESHGRRLKICVCCPVIAALLSSAVLRWGVGLCASVVLCSDQFVFASVGFWKGLELFLDDGRWSDLRVGSGPRGRRFRCCRRFLWRSSVVLTLLASLPSIFSWPLAAACPQPSLRSCPSPSTAWALMASLAQTTEAACFHPEDKARGQNDKTPSGATIQ